MKKTLFILSAALLTLASCDGMKDNPLEERMDDLTDFAESAKSFGEGGAEDGEQYFFGVLAEVIEVDLMYQEAKQLGEVDAPEADIKAKLDSCVIRANETREALKIYKDKSWPLRAEFHEITLEWLDKMEAQVNELAPLTAALAGPDDNWSQENLDQWEKYLDANEIYIECDGRWVEYQYTYADANGFMLDRNNGIDVSELAEEDLAGN